MWCLHLQDRRARQTFPAFSIETKRSETKRLPQDSILDVVTSGEIAWEGLVQRTKEPFKSLGGKCLVFGNGDDDQEVTTAPPYNTYCNC